MIYLLSRGIKFLFLGLAVATGLAITAGAAAFVITFVCLFIVLMTVDALVESVFMGFKSLLTYGSLDKAEIAFYDQFGKVARRYADKRPRQS